MALEKADYRLKLKFDDNNDFQLELQRRVEEFFHSSGRASKDNPLMYFKTFLILALFFGLYILLVFFATKAWQAVSLSIALGFAVTGIGFNIQHDAGHNAYSKHKWVNKIMAMTMDMIGGSSFIWRWKHVIFHHRYVNITDYDTDINLGGFGRVSPHKKQRPFFRWQHIYLWILYGFLVLKWHLFDDFKSIITGTIGEHKIPRPGRSDLVVFIIGKLVFFSLAFGIPLLFHPLIAVLVCYTIIAAQLGILMSIIFQMPHCVENSEFPLPNADTGRMDRPWAIHQINVTFDFERKNHLLTWLLGGLNYHMEHHLFPVICHVNYPLISHIVQKTCVDFGIEYKEHASFWTALVSHYKWLRRMGKQNSI